MSQKWSEVTRPQAIDWTIGAVIEGEYVGVEHEVGENKSNVYTLKTDDGPIAVWGSTMLDQLMKQVKAGDYIRITYVALKDSPSRKDKKYKEFKLEKRD